MPKDIYITQPDQQRLRRLINTQPVNGNASDSPIKNLAGEVGRAIVVDPEQIPRHIITMNSRVRLQLNGGQTEVCLVYPDDADWSANKVSVCSPIGMAILGYGEGDTIQWDVPSGKMNIHILQVVYQPEAAKEYHL